MTNPVEIAVSGIDAYHFVKGAEYVMVSPRKIRRVEGLFGVWWRLRKRAMRITRWWRPRTVCYAIDISRGVISMATERWSWLRWRWERR